MKAVKIANYGDASVLTRCISHVFPLSEAGKAHRLLESRQSTGKLILKVAG